MPDHCLDIPNCSTESLPDHTKLLSVMIRFSARGSELIYSWHLKGGRLFETGLISFVEKLTNVQKKSLITETVKSNNKYSE